VTRPAANTRVTSVQIQDVPLRKCKKSKKKLASHCPLTLDGNSSDKHPHLAVQKKLQKSEKKACQRVRNLISLPKPNQTNGETNDTKRTKNV
jgi:hypothetical protein